VGLVDSAKYTKFFKKQFQCPTFEDLRLPLVVTATNLLNGKVQYFSKGELIQPLIASSALPPYFSPVRIGNSLYCDGGLLNNFPIEPLKDQCDTIIGSFVNHLEIIDVEELAPHILESVLQKHKTNLQAYYSLSIDDAAIKSALTLSNRYYKEKCQPAATLDLARMEGMESGADAYIEKPFSMEFLINTITNLLRSREEIKRTYAGSPFVSSNTVAKSNVDKEFLERLRSVMQRHMSNSEFNVDQLASDMNMSRSNLNRKVRGTLNVSPNTYIRIERLKYAAQLLKAGDCKINEVCYKVGFNNSGYFTKCFYAQFGILPKDFIKSS